MIVGAVCTGNEVIAHLHRGVRDNEYLGTFVQRRGVASNNAGLGQLFRGSQVQIGGIDAMVVERIRQLYLVDVQVSSHNGQYEPASSNVADRFERLHLGDAQEGREVANGHAVGCIDLL